jgi:hypothetical protein
MVKRATVRLSADPAPGWSKFSTSVSNVGRIRELLRQQVRPNPNNSSRPSSGLKESYGPDC